MSKKKTKCNIDLKNDYAQSIIYRKEQAFKNKLFKMVEEIGIVIYCDGEYHYRHDIECREWVIGMCPDSVWNKYKKKKQKIIDDMVKIKKGNMKTFENYDITFNGHKKEVQIIKNFLDSKSKTLFIGGRPGRGKSHLAEAFFYHAIKNMKTAKMTTSFELNRIFRACAIYDERYSKFGEPNPTLFLNDIIKADFVIIDEFGVSKDSEFFINSFKEMLDLMDGKKIFVTNFGFDTLKEKYDESVISRILSGAKKVVLEGDDYRPKEALNER